LLVSRPEPEKTAETLHILSVQPIGVERPMNNENTQKQHIGALVTKPSAGRYLGVGRTAVDRMIERGQLTPVKIGDRVMVRHSELVAVVGGVR
jgi:hypothetical protein